MDAEDRRTIGEGIKTVELSWPIGMPSVRKMEPDEGATSWKRSTLSNRLLDEEDTSLTLATLASALAVLGKRMEFKMAA